MRKMLAVAILASAMLAFAVLGVVGPPTCDSCVPSGERVDPMPISGPDAVQATYGMVQRQHRRSFREHHPGDEQRQIDEYWRTPRRGDFWTPKDYKRAFP